MIPDELYVVTRGDDGPVVAGPYHGYEVAVRARDAMKPPRRWLFLPVRLWVRPMEASDAVPRV